MFNGRQEERGIPVDTFLAKDRITSVVADCKVPDVTKEDRTIFVQGESQRPSLMSVFNLNL